MNTLAASYITRLPENTSRARELEWTMQWWQQEYACAGAMKAKAWRMYDEAIEEGLSKEEIDEFYMCAEMFDAICDDTWAEWNKAQAAYLQLFN